MALKLISCTSLIVAMYHGSAIAYDTGNDLYAAMQNESERTEALRFIKGVINGSTWAYELGKNGTVMQMPIDDIKRGIGICTPNGVSMGQSFDIVRKWLKNTPEYRHADASYLVLIALRASFPCKP